MITPMIPPAIAPALDGEGSAVAAAIIAEVCVAAAEITAEVCIADGDNIAATAVEEAVRLRKRLVEGLKDAAADVDAAGAVSYTHLTLPTKRIV